MFCEDVLSPNANGCYFIKVYEIENSFRHYIQIMKHKFCSLSLGEREIEVATRARMQGECFHSISIEFFSRYFCIKLPPVQETKTWK